MQPKLKAITAKWKTALNAKEERFGTINFDDDFHLVFPMLDSADEIPVGTRLFWGLTDKLEKCTALTLPLLGHNTGFVKELEDYKVLFSAESVLRYLLIGQHYITDPTSDFVSEIVFTPQPNRDLYRTAYRFAFSHDVLFETEIQPLEATVSSWVGPGGISFGLCFKKLCSLETALEEANRFCLFLSLLAHQCVYPKKYIVGGAIPRPVALRQCKYLNNVIEQDHRTVNKRVWLAKGYGTFQSAWRTIEGIETVHMIRKGRARWVTKGDTVSQALFIAGLFSLAA